MIIIVQGQAWQSPIQHAAAFVHIHAGMLMVIILALCTIVHKKTHEYLIVALIEMTSPNTITLNGNDIEKVSNFTHLGSYISNDGNIMKEVKIRIAKTAAILKKLNTIWKSNNISRNLKLKIFNSNVILS